MECKAIWKLAGVLVLTTGLVACGDDEGDGNGEPNNGDPAAQATFETYNVGLARGFVPHARDRLDAVAEAVAQSPSDVLCLQEVWLVRDEQDEWASTQIDAIAEEASEAFPNTYHEITSEGAAVSCTSDEADPLETCVRAECDGVDPDDLADCALEFCESEFLGLSPSCQECVTGQLGSPLDDIIDVCTGEGAEAFSYGGHNGLMLMSRHELQDTEFTNFESTLVQRTALRSVVEVPDFGEVDVYCTHLAADLSNVPYTGDTYASFAEENAAQVDALLEWIDQTATTGNVVLMGDMNSGPAVGDLEAELVDSYTKFEDATFASPYVEQADPECTYCGTNTLNDGDANKAIDHVFLDFEGAAEVTNVERTFDATQSIEVDGDPMDLHLSDHFGVRVTVE